jgi:hypothetical protein
MVVAIIALVVACAGTATAATLIRSTDQVKDRVLTGRDLKRDSVTGAEVRKLSGRDVIRNGLDGSDIDETTLDVVPDATRARSADTARRASSADSVAGAAFGRIASRQVAGAGSQVVYEGGGLRLQATCSAGGGLTVQALPTGDGSGHLRTTAQRPGGSSVESDTSFGGADVVEVLPADADGVSGTITHLSAGNEVTTVQFLADESGDCVFAGNAVRTSP